MLFSERGQWLYLTAHRLPDLSETRASVANGGYGRDPETVFPTGAWFRGGVYGPDVNFPIPIEEAEQPEHAIRPRTRVSTAIRSVATNST